MGTLLTPISVEGGLAKDVSATNLTLGDVGRCVFERGRGVHTRRAARSAHHGERHRASAVERADDAVRRTDTAAQRRACQAFSRAASVPS